MEASENLTLQDIELSELELEEYEPNELVLKKQYREQILLSTHKGYWVNKILSLLYVVFIEYF